MSERAGGGGAGHRAGGRRTGVRASVVQALVDDEAGGRARPPTTGTKTETTRGDPRPRGRDERRHGERARERETQRARGAGGRRRPASQRGGRRAGPIGVSRSTATFNARRAGTRASGSRRSVVRASTSFEDAIEVAVAAVSGGATREAARRVPRRAPRSGRAPPTRDAEKDLRVQASRRGAGPALLCSAELAATSCVWDFLDRTVVSIGPNRNRAREYDRSSRNRRGQPPRGRSTNHVLPAHHAPRNHSRFPRPARRTALGARARAGYPREPRHSRRAPVPRRCVSPPRALAPDVPASRARAFASPTALSPRPPLPFAAIDPRVVTRPDRRRLARCPPAPRSPPAPGRSARPPRRA